MRGFGEADWQAEYAAAAGVHLTDRAVVISCGGCGETKASLRLIERIESPDWDFDQRGLVPSGTAFETKDADSTITPPGEGFAVLHPDLDGVRIEWDIHSEDCCEASHRVRCDCGHSLGTYFAGCFRRCFVRLHPKSVRAESIEAESRHPVNTAFAVRDAVVRMLNRFPQPVDFAVAGGFAVYDHVEATAEGSPRFTPNVDLVVRHGEIEQIADALQEYLYGPPRIPSRSKEPDHIKLSDPTLPRGCTVTLLSAGRPFNSGGVVNPPLVDVVDFEGRPTVGLMPLVRNKLALFRTIDRVHLDDMILAGLVDSGWTQRLPPKLADRLQFLLDTPDG